MNRASTLRQQLVVWGFMLGLWGLLVLAFAGQLVYTRSTLDPSFGWTKALGLSLRDWLPWLVLAPMVGWLAVRFPLERQKLGRSIPIHLVACIIAVLVCAGIPRPGGRRPALAPGMPGYGYPIPPEQRPEGAPGPGPQELPGPEGLPPGQRPLHPQNPRPGFFVVAANQSRVNIPVYWIIVSIAHALTYYRRSQERERQALELGARLADAKLQALRTQLHPHFLFNTLNAISTLVHRDARAADEMIANLSELLRATLDTSEQEITLRQELNFLDRYLEIQQARFGERLRIEKRVDAAALGALVPTLILQPLVENAVRHGIEPRMTPGTVTILAQRREGLLCLSVQDDGPGATKPEGGQPGIGLANSRARLQELYGSGARLTLNTKPAQGFTVEIELPYHQQPVSADGAVRAK